MLSVFWSAEQLTRWKSVLAAGVGPDATEVPENLLTVDPMVRGLWNKSQFVLKPVQLSEDRNQLTVEFYWLSHCAYARKRVQALPPSPRNLDSSDRGTLLVDCRAMEIIGTRHVIILTTGDPDTLPLPSIDLVEMQWVLARLVALSGAADVSEEELDSPYEPSACGSGN